MGKVIFKESGIEAEWDGSFDSLLALGEDKGLDLDFGCREGRCTACQQPLAGGEVDYPNGHTGEPNDGNILLCCSVPQGDSIVVIDA